MDGEYGPVDIAHVTFQVRIDFAEFFGHRVADGIGHIDRCGARVDGGFDHLREKLEFGGRCVFGREFHVGA